MEGLGSAGLLDNIGPSAGEVSQQVKEGCFGAAGREGGKARGQMIVRNGQDLSILRVLGIQPATILEEPVASDAAFECDVL